MNKLLSMVAIGLLLIVSSCNYSKHPIDEKPVVKVDTSLYGIWKVASDTDQRNFILVQDGSEDGIITRMDKDHEYVITYFNRGGINPRYEHYRAFLSEVKGDTFFNLSYWYSDPETDERENGYLLYKIINISANAGQMTIAMIDDATLKNAANSAEVRKRVTENLHNRSFYADTVVLQNIAHGHFLRNQAVKIAN